MKKTLNVIAYVIFFTLLMVFASCKKSSNTKYTIHGQLENIHDSLFIALTEVGDSIIIDTVKVNDKGEFKIEGNVDTLSIVSLYFTDSQANPYILVDKGWNVSVKGDLEMPDMIKVKGGDVNNNLTDFKEEVSDLLKARAEILSKEQIDSKEDSIAIKHLDMELININFELMNKAAQYIKDNPTRISSVFLINNFFKREESLDRLTEALRLLKGKALDFPMTARLKAYESYLRKSSVGAYAVSLELKDDKNENFTWKNTKDKLVILTFIGSDCQSCSEIVHELKNDYDFALKSKKDVEFIFVLMHDPGDELPDYLTKEKWTILPVTGSWSEKVLEDYNISTIPSIILIGPNGKILERNASILNIKTRIEKDAPAKPELPKSKK